MMVFFLHLDRMLARIEDDAEKLTPADNMKRLWLFRERRETGRRRSETILPIPSSSSL
jgi:hypothetical protein